MYEKARFYLFGVNIRNVDYDFLGPLQMEALAIIAYTIGSLR